LAATRGAICAEPLGQVSVRGRAEQVDVYRPLGPAPQPSATNEAGGRASVGSGPLPEQEDGP
jgi:hypothetical protein